MGTQPTLTDVPFKAPAGHLVFRKMMGAGNLTRQALAPRVGAPLAKRSTSTQGTRPYGEASAIDGRVIPAR